MPGLLSEDLELMIDLKELRRTFPTRIEALNARPDRLHKKEMLTPDDFLKEYFHRRVSTLPKTKRIIGHLIKTYGNIVNVINLMPEKLAEDDFVLTHTLNAQDNIVDPKSGIFPQHLIYSSEAMVSAGFLIPETHNILEHHPGDGIELAREALMNAVCNKRQARTVDQIMVWHMRHVFFADRYRSILAIHKDAGTIDASHAQTLKIGEKAIFRPS